MARVQAPYIWLFLAVLQLVRLHLSCATCPAVCSCLGAIVDCSRTGLKVVPRDLPEWVEELDLSDNKGLRLTTDAFKGLPVLQTLYLRKLNLSTLPRLGYLPALTELFLSDNRISRVSSLNLNGLPRLLHLDLSRNKIHTLTHEPFANVSLARLNLNRNQLSRLPASAFQTLSTLAELKLSRNHLTPAAFNLTDSAFANLTNLRVLDLSGNKLTDLRGLVFKDLKRLRILRLRRNGIETFSDGALYGLDAIEKLYLDYNNITAIRKGLLFDLGSLAHLSLKSNQIHSIRADTWQSTERLQSLDLSYNRLLVVREGTFRGLGHLTSLTLAHNHLGHIERDAFTATPSLIDLDLSHNGLRWSVEDNSGVFSSLTHLKSLSLAHNSIETIHVETLRPLVSLSSLDLLGNELRTLPHNPFSGLIHLSSVAINTSSLVCDCHLSWLPSWLASVTSNSSSPPSSSSSPPSTVECSYPPSLLGRRVASLMGTEFSCESSPRPLISRSPGDLVALHGKNVTLACVAQAGEGGAQARFIWRKDSQLLVDIPVATTEQVVTVDGRVLHNITSRLLLTNVSETDSGEYQCVVRNDFGASYSRRAHIMVHIYPYFTQQPANVAVRIGEVAKLECAANGSPTPEISLLKDGGEDFPAARERRIHVLSNETLFFIKPVTPHDEGVYTCRATNAAGTAAANATLTVRQIPEFTKRPKDEVATLGHNAVLECRGTGLPVPKLTWTKNGETLTNDGHYLLVDDSQYLLIRETRIDDLGTYTCELTNVLGTTRERINLSLRDTMSTTTTTTTTGIVVIAVVCCVVLTSLVWVVIIHQTRKRTQAGSSLANPTAYPRDEGLTRYPPPPRHNLAGHHHLTSELMHNMAPLLGGAGEGYPSAQDSGSEHSSGKDSGTGDSAQRSNEDLVPLDLNRPGLRRSLIICADSRASPLMRGVIGGGGVEPAPLGCEEVVGRPVLSTFSPQHLSPGSYGPSPHYTASLRRGSNSRLLPVSSPVTPSSTLPRGPTHPYPPRPCSPYQSPSIPPCSSETHGRGSPPTRRPSPDGGDGMDEGRGGGLQRHPNGDLPCVHRGEGTTATAAVHSPCGSVCSGGDGRSELDLRMELPEVQFSGHVSAGRPLEGR